MFDILRAIRKRKNTEYKVQLSIVQNPHLKPDAQQNLWDLLNQDDEQGETIDTTYDREGLMSLKDMFRSNPKFIVK